MLKFFLAPIVFTGLAVAVVFMYTLPQYEVFEARRAERMAYQGALDQGQEILDLRASVSARYRDFSPEERRKIYEILPPNEDVIGTLAVVDAIAEQTGVTLTSLGGDEEAGEATAQPRPFNTVGLTFDITSDYESFLEFLRAIERSLRIIDVHEISFSAPDGGEGDDEGALEFSIRANTYWLGSPPPSE